MLTLFMGVVLRLPKILTLYMLGWKGLGPMDSKNVSYVDEVGAQIQWQTILSKYCIFLSQYFGTSP